MLPWIESVFQVNGCTIFEIGCGSGAATSAMAQKCGHIDAFDIDTAFLAEAAEHMEFFGLTNVRFHQPNPDWAYPDRIGQECRRMQEQYDAVLLPAVLEHMEKQSVWLSCGQPGTSYASAAL